MKITREQITETLEKLVAEKGENYRYPGFNADGSKKKDPKYWYSFDEDRSQGTGCKYRYKNGAPLCIWGHALTRLGVKLNKGHENKMIDILMLDLNLKVDPSTLSAALTAQRAQDDGRTWAEALRYYKEALDVV